MVIFNFMESCHKIVDLNSVCHFSCWVVTCQFIQFPSCSVVSCFTCWLQHAFQPWAELVTTDRATTHGRCTPCESLAHTLICRLVTLGTLSLSYDLQEIARFIIW